MHSWIAEQHFVDELAVGIEEGLAWRAPAMKRLEAFGNLILFLIFTVPMTLHIAVGHQIASQMRVITANWPKMATDFDRMSQIYGESDAIKFAAFYTISTFLSTVSLVVLATLAWRKPQLVGSMFGLRPQGERAEFFRKVIVLAGILTALLVWIIPSWIYSPERGGITAIRNDFRSMIIIAIFHTVYAVSPAITLALKQRVLGDG